MTKREKDEAVRFLALLASAADHEQTSQEAEEELAADGVNVSDFLARANQAVLQRQKDERLAWHQEAHRNKDIFTQTQQWEAKYAAMSHDELQAEARLHANELHFKGFETATDDDLRTQLADRARLEELANKK